MPMQKNVLRANKLKTSERSEAIHLVFSKHKHQQRFVRVCVCVCEFLWFEDKQKAKQNNNIEKLVSWNLQSESRSFQEQWIAEPVDFCEQLCI